MAWDVWCERQEKEEQEDISEERDVGAFLIPLSQERHTVFLLQPQMSTHHRSLEQQTILKFYPVHSEKFLNIYLLVLAFYALVDNKLETKGTVL